MLLKLFCFTNLLVCSMSVFVDEIFDFTERNYAATIMLSRLIAESKRSTLFFMNLDSEILDAFVRSHNLQFTVEVNEVKTVSKFIKQKFGASIVHLRSYAEFENFYNLIQPEVFLYDGHFIIICDTVDALEINKIFRKLWKAYIFNVIVLTTTNPASSNLLPVFTYMPFSDESCNNTTSIRINEFNKTSMEWTTDLYFPKKFKQLNRCPIHFGCYADSPWVIVNNSGIGLKKFSGINVDIGIMISDILNFTLNILEYEQGMGIIYNNRSSTGMIKRVIENEVDLLVAPVHVERFKVLDATEGIYVDKLILVVSPPFMINPLRKVFLPFTYTSWMSIGMVALMACSVIKVLKFTPKIVQDYVIGSNVKGSILNVWNIFLGGTQPILPRRSFPRFLLAKFLIFAMIIRNLYQGGVFDIMKRDVQSVELKTIDEFIEHKYTFYIYPSLEDRLQGSKVLQRQQLIKNSQIRQHNVLTLNPSFQGVVFNYLKPVLYENLIHRKNYTLKICKEVVFSNSFVFYFTKNFYLLDEFNELVQRFTIHGLTDHIMSKYLDLNLMTTIQKNAPSALIYRNIEGFFVLFYCGCVMSLVSFLCEIGVVFYQRRHENSGN